MRRVAPTKMFVTVQDITDRKRAEEALQLSQFYLSEGERLAHMGSWAFNPVGFDYWSAELFEVHGLDPSGRPPIVERYSPHDCVQNVSRFRAIEMAAEVCQNSSFQCRSALDPGPMWSGRVRINESWSFTR